MNGLGGQGLLIVQVEPDWRWRGRWHPCGKGGGVWNPELGIGLGREFRPLATLGVTEGAGTIKRPWLGGGVWL